MRFHQILGFLMNLFLAVTGRTGFKKDQSTNVAFPPRIGKPVSGVPLGHLRPIGKVYVEADSQFLRKDPTRLSEHILSRIV